MKSLGIKSVRIDSIKLPGDMKRRMGAEHVIAMSKTLEGIGLLERPKVRKADMAVIIGRDRIAAHLVAGRDEVEVELMECSDEDAVEADRVSNAHRRHDRNEQQRLMVELVEARTAEQKRVVVAASPGPGRPKTPRGRARDDVAAQLGVKPESVRQAEYRHRKRDEANGTPGFNTFDIPLEEAFVAECLLIKGMTGDVARGLGRALKDMQRLTNADVELHGATERLLGKLEELELAVRGIAPAALCPYCKCIEGLTESCACCLGKGWVTKDELAGAPKELTKRGDDAVVMDNGQVVKANTLIEMDGTDWVDG